MPANQHFGWRCQNARQLGTQEPKSLPDRNASLEQEGADLGAASSFTVQASAAPVHAQDEIEGVIAALAANPGAGIIAMPDLFNTINRDVIIAWAARYRIPAIYFFRSFADSGGLISYGPDFADQYPRAAGYIDRILKGEKPGDLPIQMPVKVPLIINLRTANALGLDVPLGLLNAADEIIE